MANQQVTVKDIAELAGVSVATVSRVINQNGRFSAETEQRVRQVIEKYDYQPNQLAKGLRQRRVDAIGVIVPRIANEFFSSMILAMQERFFAEGYSMTIYNTNNSVDVERQCHAHLAAQNVSGVISVNSREDVRAALRRKVPTVYVDRFVGSDHLGENVACISSDNVRSGHLAADELWASGSRRPITITASEESPVTVMRTKGFADGLLERGYQLPQEAIVAPEATSYENGREAMERIIASGTEFDGIFCQTDWLAMGVLEVLREHHIAVPDEVSVVGHDDILISRFGRPPLTTIHQDSTQIGERAADLMLGMMEGRAPEQQMVTVPVGLVRRESTRHDVAGGKR